MVYDINPICSLVVGKVGDTHYQIGYRGKKQQKLIQ
jgi:hypothetical protein